MLSLEEATLVKLMVAALSQGVAAGAAGGRAVSRSRFTVLRGDGGAASMTSLSRRTAMAAFLCSLERVLSQSAVEGGAVHVVGVEDGTKRGQVGVSLAAGLRPCASDRLGADVVASSARW